MSIKGINFGLLTRRGGYRISSGNARRGSRKYTQRIAAHCCIRWFIRGSHFWTWFQYSDRVWTVPFTQAACNSSFCENRNKFNNTYGHSTFVTLSILLKSTSLYPEDCNNVSRAIHRGCLVCGVCGCLATLLGLTIHHGDNLSRARSDLDSDNMLNDFYSTFFCVQAFSFKKEAYAQ